MGSLPAGDGSSARDSLRPQVSYLHRGSRPAPPRRPRSLRAARPAGGPLAALRPFAPGRALARLSARLGVLASAWPHLALRPRP